MKGFVRCTTLLNILHLYCKMGGLVIVLISVDREIGAHSHIRVPFPFGSFDG